jgi:hypothetical protein
VLRGWRKGPLRGIRQLKLIPYDFKDKFSDPLVRDLPEELYLAPEYERPHDTGRLESLGLDILDMDDIIARFHNDLQ